MHYHLCYTCRKHRFVAFIKDLIKKIEKKLCIFRCTFSYAHEDVNA